MRTQASFTEKLLKKQFPTLLGIGILLVALVAGIILLSGDTSVFSPRATPQTTPKNVKISNLTDSGFTISFLTDEDTAGFVKYGTKPDDLKSQISDDRDQLSGTIGQFNTHHISLRGLQANTNYYYVLGTGSGTVFDDSGSAFSIKTLASVGSPSAAKTVYGKVLLNGNPAIGSMVYITSSGIGELSGLVKDSASWAIPLSNARKADGSFAQITDSTVLNITIQGDNPTLRSTASTTVKDAQPVADIALGSNLASTTSIDSSTSTPTFDDLEELEELDKIEEVEQVTINPGGLANILSEDGFEETQVVVDLTASSSAEIIVDSMQPTIMGEAAPEVTISVTINSETQIEQELITDSDGNFVIDLTELEQELEPGEHTVTYCYDDPDTGEEICQTQTFTVTDTNTLLAQANTENNLDLPYGSGNPYSIGGASESAEASESGEASASTSISKGGKTSLPSTASGVPVSGSVETTLALVIGGIFFILAALWSYYLAVQFDES
ncbi:MAG: fibronectin type III domain-containing protein [Patescibacteria group bacterium]